MEFKQFELEGWERSAQHYHSSFTQLTEQVIDPLLERIAPTANAKLLDIATGSGALVRRARARGIDAIGLDFSPEMLALATELSPTAPFVQGDAEELPFSSEMFDAAVMCFGILHLAHPEVALKEMHRVVVQGGCGAFTAWASPTQSVAFSIISRAVERFGDPSVTLPEGPPFFRYSEKDECIKALSEAGFGECHVESLPLEWTLDSPEALFNSFYYGTARTGGLLRAQKPEDIVRIKEMVCEDAAQFVKDGEIKLPMVAVIAYGRRV